MSRPVLTSNEGAAQRRPHPEIHRGTLRKRAAVIVTLAEEVQRSRFQVVHCSRNLYRLRGFKVAKYRAIPPNRVDRQLHILSCHRVHKR